MIGHLLIGLPGTLLTIYNFDAHVMRLSSLTLTVKKLWQMLKLFDGQTVTTIGLTPSCGDLRRNTFCKIQTFST